MVPRDLTGIMDDIASIELVVHNMEVYAPIVYGEEQGKRIATELRLKRERAEYEHRISLEDAHCAVIFENYPQTLRERVLNDKERAGLSSTEFEGARTRVESGVWDDVLARLAHAAQERACQPSLELRAAYVPPPRPATYDELLEAFAWNQEGVGRLACKNKQMEGDAWVHISPWSFADPEHWHEQKRRSSYDYADAVGRTYESVFLDVDGVLVDAYDDEDSPLRRHLHLIASAGIPIAICTGRTVGSKLLGILGDARSYPGLRIYGQNGMDVHESIDGVWTRVSNIIENDKLSEHQLNAIGSVNRERYHYGPGYGMEILSNNELRTNMESIADLIDSINMLQPARFYHCVTKVKYNESSSTISINTAYRDTVREQAIDPRPMALLETRILGSGIKIPETHEMQVGGDGIQIRPKILGKVPCFRHFNATSWHSGEKTLCIADQGLADAYLPLRTNGRAKGEGIWCRRGGDHELLSRQTSVSVDVYTSPLWRTRGFRGALAPYPRSIGAAYTLETVLFRPPRSRLDLRELIERLAA